MAYQKSLRKHPALKGLPSHSHKKEHSPFEIVVMGSAVGEVCFRIEDELATDNNNIKFVDKKIPPTDPNEFKQQRIGGGAWNFTENALKLAQAFNIPVHITMITKLGREKVYNEIDNEYELNIGRAMVMTKLENKGHAVDIIDTSENPRRIAPLNAVFQRETKRMIRKGPELSPGTSEAFNAKTMQETPHANDITVAMQRADYALIQAKWMRDAAYAARCADPEHTEVIVDYDRSTTDDPELADELLQNTKVALVDANALGPNMQEANPDALREELVNNGMRYPIHLTAITDGIKDIKVNYDFENFEMPVALKELDCIDKNGSGDLRNAAFVIFRILGMNKPTAAYWASALASFGTSYPEREWAKHLDKFLDLMKKDLEQTPALLRRCLPGDTQPTTVPAPVGTT